MIVFGNLILKEEEEEEDEEEEQAPQKEAEERRGKVARTEPYVWLDLLELWLNIEGLIL